MLGLLGTLTLGSRSLATQRQGVEVAGHNLANASNPAYSRQRVAIASTAQIVGPGGPVGTGAEATHILQIRSRLLDDQVVSEESVGGALEARQRGLQYVQARLGQQVDRLATGPEGASAANGVGGGRQIASGLADFFAAFQSLSTQPTSMPERQIVVMRAAAVASQFNRLDAGLAQLQSQLTESAATDVRQANALLSDVAALNDRIAAIEGSGSGTANDLRDHRQRKLEELSRLVRFEPVSGENGSVDINIGGTLFVAGGQTPAALELHDPGNGRPVVRAVGAAAPLALTGGSIQGTLEVRDGEAASLRAEIDAVAANLVAEVNAAHAAGFGLDGATGSPFFLGGGAADIRVDPTLAADPARIQASGDPAAPGDNGAALAVARVGARPLAALGGQTLGGRYAQSVAALGEALDGVNRQYADHGAVADMLRTQRDSVSGVSVDEEMTDLTRYQRAYQASAKLINTVDELLDLSIGLKR